MKQLLFVLFVFLFAACSASKSVDPLAQVGASKFGTDDAFVTFEVPDDQEQPFLLRRSTPAGRRLSELFLKGEKSVLKIIVGGPSSETTKKAILEAFTMNRGRLLGGLEIVFVGDLIDAREVAKVAKQHLATVHYSSLNTLLEAGYEQ